MNKILQVFDADLSRRQVSADFIANQQITFYQACNGFSLVQSRAFFILTRLLRKLYNNRVTIRTHQMDPCGFGVYPVVSCINHHCRPNAAFVFNGNRLLLTSIRRIKSSEEITVRYMDSYRVPRIKEMLIQKRFGFDCHCSFCYVLFSLTMRGRAIISRGRVRHVNVCCVPSQEGVSDVPAYKFRSCS